jgi:hypothetical protein
MCSGIQGRLGMSPSPLMATVWTALRLFGSEFSKPRLDHAGMRRQLAGQHAGVDIGAVAAQAADIVVRAP